LFAYLGEDGEVHPVSSGDVNAYIHAVLDADYSAKHFRTWGASVVALAVIVAAGDQAVSRKAVVEPVSEALGNTPAVARSAYIHPRLLDLASDLKLRASIRFPKLRARKHLSSIERTLVEVLDQLTDGD